MRLQALWLRSRCLSCFRRHAWATRATHVLAQCRRGCLRVDEAVSENGGPDARNLLEASCRGSVLRKDETCDRQNVNQFHRG